jgi:hypothetical protein
MKFLVKVTEYTEKLGDTPKMVADNYYGRGSKGAQPENKVYLVINGPAAGCVAEVGQYVTVEVRDSSPEEIELLTEE